MADQNQRPAAATPPQPSLISAADISYAGCFRLPREVAASTFYAYGGITGRKVDGQLRLLITGSEAELDSPVMEIADPEHYHENYREAPQAEFTRKWDTRYRAKRGTWRGPLATDRPAEPFLPFAQKQAINLGLHWHDPTGLLYMTYADTYNVGGYGDWGLIAVRLNDDLTTEGFGPWRVKATDSRGTWYGPHRSMFLAAHPQTGKLLTGAAFSSGVANFPWGPDLYGDLDWPTPSTPAGVRAPELALGKRYLEYYYMGGLIDAASGQAKGPIKSFRRRVDPPLYEYFPATPDRPADMATNVNPARYNGVGSWGEMDYVGGLIWLQTATKRGVLFCGTVAGSPIQDPKNPKASHVWYANEFKPRCSHGVPTPDHRSGLDGAFPVSLRLRPGAAGARGEGRENRLRSRARLVPQSHDVVQDPYGLRRDHRRPAQSVRLPLGSRAEPAVHAVASGRRLHAGRRRRRARARVPRQDVSFAPQIRGETTVSPDS
jgi:hypothetical protein